MVLLVDRRAMSRGENQIGEWWADQRGVLGEEAFQTTPAGNWSAEYQALRSAPACRLFDYADSRRLAFILPSI
jgi:hypothetical protein